MKIPYLLPIFSFITFFAYGQNKETDSLTTLLRSISDSREKLQLLENITDELVSTDIKKYGVYSDSITVISKRTNNKNFLAKGYFNKGIYFYNISENDSSLSYYKKSLRLYKELNDKEGVSNLLGNIGQCYHELGIKDSSRYYLDLSIKKSLEINNYSRLFYCNYSLGVYESEMSNNSKAVEYLIKAIDYANKSNNDIQVARANGMLGVIYDEQEFYDEAEEKYFESLKVFQKLNDKRGMGVQYANLAGLYALRDGNYEKSNELHHKAITNYEAIGSKKNICIAQYNLGRNFLNQKILDSARYYLNKSYSLGKSIGYEYGTAGVLTDIAELEYLDKNYRLAEQLLKQSLKELESDDFIYEKSKALMLTATVYADQNRYEEAYDNYVYGKEIEDSLFSLERSTKILELETKYQTEKKEKENLQLKADNTEQALLTQKANTRNWILGLGILLLSVSAFFIWRRYKAEAKAKQIISDQKDEIEQQKNRVETLQKELHHRMKNNLSFIDLFINLAKGRFEDKAYQNKLNELQNRMRSMFEVHKQLFKKDDVTSVQAKNYIDTLVENVKQAYEKDSVTITNTTNENETLLANTSFPVGLIVNEFITNSYKYAFEDQKEGTIHIALTSQDTIYKLTLKDNGKGLPKDFDINTLDSFGLETIQLLTKEYGGTFTIDGTNGVTMNITLPKTTA